MMVEIGLLIGADAQNCKRGPIVRLPKGVWAIRISGVVSSILRLNANGSSAEINNEHELVLKEPHDVCVEIAKRGNDRSMNVKACWLRGVDDGI